MRNAVRDHRLVDARGSSTVGLSVQLPNGGVVGVDAPIGQTISAVLVAQGVPLKHEIATVGDCPGGDLGVAELPTKLSCDTTVRPEHDGLAITLDAAIVEPQTYWTAG